MRRPRKRRAPADWARRLTRHTPVDHQARADELAKLLGQALDEWRFTMDSHGISCGSCRVDLGIYERHARTLGVTVRELSDLGSPT